MDGLTLGRRMHTQGVVLRGQKTEDEWRFFLRQCAIGMKMEPAGKAAVWHYPVDGKGGSGMTMLQPITESFLALDTWPDHTGAYLFIASCRKFDVADLFGAIHNFGLAMDEMSAPSTLKIA
jgi:S-adenosylmethionine/arginine decarboxylase-like enzyme